jgi:hypothetical protein
MEKSPAGMEAAESGLEHPRHWLGWEYYLVYVVPRVFWPFLVVVLLDCCLTLVRSQWEDFNLYIYLLVPPPPLLIIFFI